MKRGELAVPGSEEVVLACGYHNDGKPAGLQYDAALAASDRFMQRQRLDDACMLLNPRWHSVRLAQPFVIKQRSSTLSEGVMCPGHQERRLKDWRGYEDYVLVAEEFIPGQQWEINGVVGEREVLYLWHAVRHTWDQPGGKILRYDTETRVPLARKLGYLACEAVMACGLQWCGFNVELRGTPEQLRVVEVHARLGEESDDGEYIRAWTHERHPLAVLCEELLLELKRCR